MRLAIEMKQILSVIENNVNYAGNAVLAPMICKISRQLTAVDCGTAPSTVRPFSLDY